MRRLLPLLLICISRIIANAQTYSPVITAWQNAGYNGSRPSFAKTISIQDYGADDAGTASANPALTAAINALGGRPGVIFFPAGSYFFDAPITISRDSIILRGAGYDSTTLRFDLAGVPSNLINISGADGGRPAPLSASGVRGATSIILNDAISYHAGDWITLSINDSAYMSSPWAYGSLAQTMQIQGIGHDTVRLGPLRFNFTVADRPVVRGVVPRNNIGIECLKLQRIDATAGQSSNISFDRAVNCWVSGIESDTTNFAHVEIAHSSNIEITNSYFHDAFSYGGGGQAYGVLLEFGSGECKVEANYFRHLRHSMALQAGANGNVLAYNYATMSHWDEPGLPDSAAGDIVLHGNYPFMNLAEGNIVNNIVIDDSHGKNGPLNTFFRNRAAGYGVFMNFNPATDSQQFIGNEITSSRIGLFFIKGTGHFIYGNNYRGAIIDGGGTMPDTSLYLPARGSLLCAAGYDAWPAIGGAGGYNTGRIYAQVRADAGQYAACSCTTELAAATIGTTTHAEDDWTIFPNPADKYFFVKGPAVEKAELYNVNGELIQSQLYPPANKIAVVALSSGTYMLRLIGAQKAMSRRVLIQR